MFVCEAYPHIQTLSSSRWQINHLSAHRQTLRNAYAVTKSKDQHDEIKRKETELKELKEAYQSFHSGVTVDELLAENRYLGICHSISHLQACIEQEQKHKLLQKNAMLEAQNERMKKTIIFLASKSSSTIQEVKKIERPHSA